MAIEVDWGNLEETLATMKFRGDWNAQHLLDAQTQFCEMAELKTHTVDVIVDMRAASLKMNGVLALARRVIPACPQNVGRIAIITTTAYWEQMYRTLPDDLTDTLRVQFVSDVDAAYAAIDSEPHSRKADYSIRR
jgi:hypothetical protein